MALHVNDMVKKPQEPALGRRTGFGQGAVETQVMTL